MNQPANEQWIRNYPNLGTEQISTEAATSPEFFEQERDQVFFRSIALAPMRLATLNAISSDCW